MASTKRRRTRISQEHSFTVIYEPVPRKGYQVIVPLLPGLVSYGRTFEEAREMARYAIRCHLSALVRERERIPSERALLQERVTVAV
jgi:predicted RNase H-like HicB family nuclease